MVYKEERFWVFVVVGCLRVSHFVMVHIGVLLNMNRKRLICSMKTNRQSRFLFYYKKSCILINEALCLKDRLTDFIPISQFDFINLIILTWIGFNWFYLIPKLSKNNKQNLTINQQI
jgi:hypothetical protein